MPMTQGLFSNIRLAEEQPKIELGPEQDIIDSSGQENADKSNFDDKGNLISIEHPDGSITISIDGKPLEGVKPRGPTGWFDNLVEDIDQGELSRIADDLLRGIDDDMQSRSKWVSDRAKGLKLLGLELDVPAQGASADGAPVEGMSRVRHPLLLEAVLRFQANARSELLPTDGPVKIRNDDNNTNLQEDKIADCLEKDMNHYLTSTAAEYYPDTDRMLLMLGFGGTAYKKVYLCPLRNRPVSESVDADDLIVNESATDLRNASRITHRTYLKPSTVKRLQILGVYRDIDLPNAKMPTLDDIQRQKKDQQGLTPTSKRPDENDREIYEIYCELDLLGFEHRYKGKLSGLEVPYRVTIDFSSREILSIVRNYDEDTKDLPEARTTFVKYTFVPGLGFHDIGLLHILGNTTNALTAAWREMLDAGMFANFPGFLMADSGARQNTNIFRVPPGGGALVKTNGMPLKDAIMPMPYKDIGGGLMSLTDNMAQTGMRIGGTSEQQVGEGRADAPVGTTLAMIDQATKVLNAVHKRMHAAQAEEFRLIMDCFREHPEAFWQRNKKPAYSWDQETFLTALNDCDLVPQADPNTASHGQRMMKVAALNQVAQGNPQLFDPVAVATATLQEIGWSNPEQFYLPPQMRNKPDPKMMELQGRAQIEQGKLQIEQQDAQARMVDAQTKANDARIRQQIDHAKVQIEFEKARSQERYAQQELGSKAEERITNERIQLIDLAQNLAVHPESAMLIQPLIEPTMQDIVRQQMQAEATRKGLVPPAPNAGGMNG